MYQCIRDISKSKYENNFFKAVTAAKYTHKSGHYCHNCQIVIIYMIKNCVQILEARCSHYSAKPIDCVCLYTLTTDSYDTLHFLNKFTR